MVDKIFPNDEIRTADLRCWKQPLYQLSTTPTLPWSEGELIDLKASSFSSYRIGGDDDDSDESSEEEDIFGISYLGSIPAPALDFK